MSIGKMWLFGILAAEGGTKEPSTNWANIALIGGMVVALITAGLALYRARSQKDLDTGTKRKIDQEVTRLQTEHDTRRTVRVLRLERYVDADIAFHRRQNIYLAVLVDLLDEAVRGGFLPSRELPPPPEPPQLPDMPEDSDDPG